MQWEEGERLEKEWADLTLTIHQVLYLAGRWLPALTVLSFGPYLIIWGLPGLPIWPGVWETFSNSLLWTFAALLIYAASALVHEALHLVAMLVVARVPASSLRFGMRLSEGVLYVHSDRSMSARAYRIVLLLPAIALGLLPAAVGTIQGRGWLVAYGYVMLVSAIGDLIVLQLMRHVDARTHVRDHPDEIGCQVRISPSLS